MNSHGRNGNTRKCYASIISPIPNDLFCEICSYCSTRLESMGSVLKEIVLTTFWGGGVLINCEPFAALCGLGWLWDFFEIPQRSWCDLFVTYLIRGINWIFWMFWWLVGEMRLMNHEQQSWTNTITDVRPFTLLSIIDYRFFHFHQCVGATFERKWWKTADNNDTIIPEDILILLWMTEVVR